MLDFSRFRDFSPLEQVFCVLIFAFPIFFLTLKGWTNTIYFLIFATALGTVLADRSKYFVKTNKRIWIVFWSLVTPFLAEILAQLFRHDLIWRSLDSPSRFLGAAILVLYLSRSRITNEVFFLFCAGAWLSCCITFGYLIINQENFWAAGRAATYFVDPNNLGFNILLLVICSAYLTFFSNSWSIRKIYLALSLVAGVYVLLLSGSRTSWFAFLIVMEVSILVVWWRKKSFILLAHLVLLLLAMAIWETSGIVRHRILELFGEIQNISDHSIPSSAGFRLRLFLLDIELLKRHYILGVPDGNLPPFLDLKKNIDWLRYQDYRMMVVAGSHSEFMAQLVRKGLVLGTMTVASIVLFPTWFFIKRLRSSCERDWKIAVVAVVIVSTLLVSGWALEFSNVKMNASFLSIFLAIAYSCFLVNQKDT